MEYGVRVLICSGIRSTQLNFAGGIHGINLWNTRTEMPNFDVGIQPTGHFNGVRTPNSHGIWRKKYLFVLIHSY